MKNIIKVFSSILLGVSVSVLMISSTLAAGGSDVALDEAHVNTKDKASLQNGAKLFVNYCLSCHSASYARYNRVAKDLDIPEALLKENLMFTTEKTGDLMTTTMSASDSKRWFGVTPPDLTLVSRVRKPDWVYTYLRAFYADDSSPSGWNNSLFKNVAMPHALYELQGVQRLLSDEEVEALVAHSSDADHNSDGHHDADENHYANVADAKFELVHPGKLTPKEFDQAMLDLTNFLVYLAEPAQLQREKIGIFTLLFLIILMGLAFLLKKEFWRDVH